MTIQVPFYRKKSCDQSWERGGIINEKCRDFLSTFQSEKVVLVDYFQEKNSRAQTFGEYSA